jgi:hypothetical protein
MPKSQYPLFITVNTSACVMAKGRFVDMFLNFLPSVLLSIVYAYSSFGTFLLILAPQVQE